MKEPDGLEKGVRFGCGFMAGSVAGLYIAVRYFNSFSILIVAVVAISFGLLAMLMGDEFWELLFGRFK